MTASTVSRPLSGRSKSSRWSAPLALCTIPGQQIEVSSLAHSEVTDKEIYRICSSAQFIDKVAEAMNNF
jgi:hypothetical protein